ncbi:hypothetical protein CCY01nite_17340 [Chitinophaga cymbidii]|uniref:Uncharacterized protein n=1 Tax=Chitinophaga cymbidii TaxID=1096750 RepID=A0A512RIG9_9BACT|nr:hypothetical protein CCY01nite_17340 [Chitinophaga cymbidii]
MKSSTLKINRVYATEAGTTSFFENHIDNLNRRDFNLLRQYKERRVFQQCERHDGENGEHGL